MQKIYSLLRNNKQTGPYTLEELAGLSLKPFDLIWIEGKSGGWSYPSEIDALKYIVDTQPVEKLKEPIRIVQSEEAPEAINTEIKSKSANTGKHIYISFPAGNALGKTVINNFSTPVQGEESPEAKLERKAQELRSKIQAFAEGKKELKEDNELATKYARSLDDIKEEYSDWLHQQKRKKDIPYKKLIAAAGIIVVIGIGYFVAHKLIASTAHDNKNLVVQNSEEKKADTLQGNEDNPTIRKKISKKTDPITATALRKKRGILPADKIDAYIDSLRKAEKKEKENGEYATNQEGSTGPSRQQRTEPAASKQSKETHPATTSTKESSASFAQLVQLSESTGSEGSKLTIYNNSDRFLNFVAVDVYYYRANDKLLQRKTLYFNNISPKTSSPLYVPELRKAASVKYQLGLISSEDGLYYAKQ